MEKYITILKALADETRLRIINLLYEGELCVCHIEAALAISQTKASRHLTILKNAGLVTSRKQAQWVYYTLINLPETAFIDTLILKNVRTLKTSVVDLKQIRTITCKPNKQRGKTHE